MTPTDDAILSLLGPPKQLELRSGDIARNTGYSRRRISDRCTVLVDRGLLFRDDEAGHPYYGLTDFGERYVAGELTVDNLEKA